MARYGNVDIFKLRGKSKFTHDEKLILAHHLATWLERESAPLSDTPDADDD